MFLGIYDELLDFLKIVSRYLDYEKKRIKHVNYIHAFHDIHISHLEINVKH